ncbi:unnamed protein product [Tetraodon nigroviridis]|nr:unnamed protein product [Tetraodon nigroviridis]
MTQSLQEVQEYLKELEAFLVRHDEAQLQKRKWQHLNWTYNVWLPLQKRIERHLSRSRYMRERQSTYRACAEDSENRRYNRQCRVAGCKYNPSQSNHPVNKPAVSDTSSPAPHLDPRSGRRFFSCL